MAARLTGFIVVAIVAVTLIAGLMVGAQRDDNGPVDLIVFNGKVYAGGGPVAEAVAVRGNQILRVGSNREIKRLRRVQTTIVDAHGGSVLPGFNDSHVHLLDGGLARGTVDLSGAATLLDIQDRIASFAAANPDRPWIDGRGWSYDAFPGGLPTREQLDATVPDRPARLVSWDGRATWVNTKALALAGIGRRTPHAKAGFIVKDSRTGEPTGVLKEAAQDLVARVLPAPARDDQLDAIVAATRVAHRLGITSLQTAGGTPEQIDLFGELQRTGALTLRVYSALAVGLDATDAALEQIEAVRRRYPDDALFKTGAVELVADGIAEARGAAPREPAETRAAKATPNLTVDDLNRIVRSLDARGWQVLIRASSDDALRLALGALERAARANPVPARGRRPRIEHLEDASADDLSRLELASVIASMQPSHAAAAEAVDATAAGAADGTVRAWPWNSLNPVKARMVFGSDWPLGSLNPIDGIALATSSVAAPADDPSAAAEDPLPLAAAIDAYTRNAAYASFDEMRKGTLAPGMLADLVILSTDIFSLPPDRLRQAVVNTTIFDGRIVYSRDEEETEP